MQAASMILEGNELFRIIKRGKIKVKYARDMPEKLPNTFRIPTMFTGNKTGE